MGGGASRRGELKNPRVGKFFMMRLIVILVLLLGAALVSAMLYFDETPPQIWKRIAKELTGQPAPQAPPAPRPSPVDKPTPEATLAPAPSPSATPEPIATPEVTPPSVPSAETAPTPETAPAIAPAAPPLTNRTTAAKLLPAAPAMVQGITSDPLKSAALTWAIAECQRLFDAGKAGNAASAARADELANDIVRMARDPQVSEKKDPPKQIFPEIRDMANNPGAKGLFEMKPYEGVNPSHPKKNGAKPDLDDGDALLLAYAALHPQSPARGDAQAIVALLTAMNQSWCIREKETWGEHNPIMAYTLLNAVYPNLVPASVRKAWESVMRARCDKQIKDYVKILDDGYISRSWLNGDIRNFIQVGFCGLALNDAKYREWMDKAAERLYLTLQPDGATNYTGYQNEVWPYHDAAVVCMTWYWLFTGDETARKYVANSAPYYPMTTQRFIGEYYTAPEQKHYYNGARATWPYIGWLAGDPFAVVCCNNAASLLNAFFYDPSLASAQLPDNYMIFDRNIIGPRGKFGNMDFAVSTRDFSYYPDKKGPGGRTPEKGFGVTTFLGMRAMYSPEEEKKAGFPMNAVVERMMNHVTIGKQAYDKGQELESSVAMAGGAAGVSAKYSSSARVGQNRNWDPVPFVNFQSWIVTGERAVGLMKIEALKQVKDARISTMFEFVSGRAHWGKRKEFEKLDTWTYRYGDLKLRVPATSYLGVETAYGNGGLTGGDQMRGFLRLVEEPGKADTLKDYQPGANDWCLAEITPVWSEPAKEIKQLDLGANLIGFQFTASGKSFALVQNSTDTVQTATFAMPPGYSKYSLHLGTDGNVDRDKFLNRAEWEKKRGEDSGNRVVTLNSPKISFPIPPGRNILVIASNASADHVSGMKFYEDVFVKPRR